MEPENRQMWDDVSPTLKAKLLKVLELKKLPLDQLAFDLIVLDTSQTFTSVGDLVNYYEKKNQTLSLEKWKFIFKKLQLSKEFEDLVAQDSGFFSEEGNSHPQMASLSTALMDTPASGHEGVQHQNSASCIVLEGGKTEHQIQSMMSRFKLTRTRPNTPEGAQPGSNSPSLVTGRHNNRPNQYDSVEVDGVSENGEKSDRAVEQYDSTENNGFVDETKQLRRLLEDQEQLINAILEENRRLCLLMAVLRCEVRRADDVACGGSGAVVELNHASDSNDIQRLEGEHRQEMERMREEHRQDIQRLEGEHRQEMERMREEHRQARQAGDVASQGSSAAVKDEYMSDSSDELEPGADEQIGPSPYLFESDPEDFTDDEFFDAVDH